MKLLRLFLVLSGFVFAVNAVAKDVYVPEDLASWENWVLHGHEYVACPLSGKDFRCVWPGRLKLNVNQSGGTFRQVVEVFDAQSFKLPGGGDSWPLDVTVDGKPVPVVKHDQGPVVFLAAGTHMIAGSFLWSRLPDNVLLNNGTGLLSLSIDNKPVARPRWNANEVWIGQGQQTVQQAKNNVSVSVYRLISDGAPVTMDVQVQIDIAGESREETIGQLVPPGFVPANLQAPLPARLDDEGNLKIQARPGSWVFTFRALAQAPLTGLAFEPSGEHWPAEEVWSYAAAADVRATELRADNAVDPEQSGVPPAWRKFPAFQMKADDTFDVIERQRGRAVGESNRLKLQRELWLDFDREGYTARDTVTGSMVRDWRLDMLGPLKLESAQLRSPHAGSVNLLVTEKPGDSAARGVELRTPSVGVIALSRLESNASTIPVAGWNTRFDEVSTRLYLPPGHRLLGASNVDRANGSWIERWDLLDFFMVLIVTVAVWRLVAPWAGAVALLALTLSFHESGAPQVAWLNLIAAFAVAKYFPEGKLRSLARGYSALSLVAITLVLLPFAASALRTAVYPQLEQRTQSYSSPTALERSFDHVEADLEEVVVANTVNSAPTEMRRKVAVTGSRSNVINRYAANARVQTGPGVPSWQWGSSELYWNGPVDVEQTSTLWIAPPWMMRLWRVAMVGLLAALLAGFARYALSLRVPLHDSKAERKSGHAAGVLVATFLTLSLAAPVPQVNADTPDAQVLDQLRQRLLERPECVPQCVDISRARVTYQNAELSIELIAHAQSHAVLKLPGRSGAWMPEKVSVDGELSDAIRLGPEGAAELMLIEGVHRVVLTGSLPNANSVGVPFPVQPHHINVDGSGWEVTGVANARLTGGALTLIRQQTGRERAALDAVDVEQFPAFVIVHRRLRFDLDWSVVTTVERVTPPNAAINLGIPLLEGESITQEDIDVDSNLAQISIPTGARSVSWSSTLVRKPDMELLAARDVPWQERWELQAGESWRLEFSGVPELNTNRQQEVEWLAKFTPWPGEKLALNLSRPDAVQGATTAIDKVVLRETVGARSSSVQLDFSYRATRGSQHVIGLPAGSDLTRVTVDGQLQNLALEEGQLRLPIVPGTHQVNVLWRGEEGAAFHTQSAAVDLGMPASNVTSVISGNANRWTLWTHGPQQGPAVLYWSELLALFCVAIALARFGGTPLKTHHWVLLGLGFSTFFWPAFAVVATALLALAWRSRQSIEGAWRFNGIQVLLGLLVLGAVFALLGAIPFGLLGEANMHIAGNSSSATNLRWFIDQTVDVLPAVGVYSVPMWVYKALILLWALWLAFALLRWLPWMWHSYSHDGFWRARRKETPSDVMPD